VIEGVEKEAAGSFSMRIHSPKVESFDAYYLSLNPINNTQNPWFREFWQQKFNCQFTVAKDDFATPVCTGRESLATNYLQVLLSRQTTRRTCSGSEAQSSDQFDSRCSVRLEFDVP
jgi:hypothetical protein